MTQLVRRNHGRNHSYLLDGEKAPGVTTILRNGFPSNLIDWAARTAAKEVRDRWDVLAELDEDARYDLVRTAPNRDRDAAARRGTEVHGYAHRLAAGEEVDVPDELVGHVDAYLRFVEEWKPREILVEAPIANTRWRYCGTTDLVADLIDEQRWLLDIKTTRSGVFLKDALQLTAYRRCDVVLRPDGVVDGMPQVDRCGVLWLQPDRSYELVPVAAGEAEFRIFLCALQTARFVERTDVLGAPLFPPIAQEVR